MRSARRMTWWLAVPAGIALGLAVAVGIDRAADPAAAQGGRSGFTISAEQLRINQRIGQQGVKRANRANGRLDRLTTGRAGPAGPVAPAGPAGRGAQRAAYSAAVGAPAQTVLDAAGVTISVACEAGSGGEATLALTFGLAEAMTFAGTITRDSGTDPNAPGLTELEGFRVPFPAGQNPAGGPSAPDGEFVREVSSVMFIAPTRALGVHAALVADGAADRCSLNGVAVPS